MIQSTSICFAKNFVRHGYDILLAQMSRIFEILQEYVQNRAKQILYFSVLLLLQFL